MSYKKELEKISLIEKELINSIKKNENTNIKNLQLANTINFKSAPDKLIETDEFGFLKKQDESIDSSNSISKSDRYSIGHKDDKSSSNSSSRSSSSGSKSGSNPFDQSSYRNKDNNNNFFLDASDALSR